jgi:predicted RNase H-like HicB family nuclease
MSIKYQLVIYWSDEDECFVVEVPELPGCFADGQSYTEAVRNVEVVIREWIATAQELGREVPAPRGRLMSA